MAKYLYEMASISRPYILQLAPNFAFKPTIQASSR